MKRTSGKIPTERSCVDEEKTTFDEISVLNTGETFTADKTLQPKGKLSHVPQMNQNLLRSQSRRPLHSADPQ